MGRLKAMAPRLGTVTPRLGTVAGDERGRDKVRRDTQAWRAWYKTARWQKLRQTVLVRDLYTCQRTGVLCTGKGNAPNAPVVNHKRPHRGDERLFWDIDNLETVTKAVHDGEIQKEERAGRHG